ncbi:MAG: DUF3391 domain-containing protein [Gammaproteobacteria bacterium]|nr:DUF3391 domain-containing protein [Gammaproteobacteria bacterium]
MSSPLKEILIDELMVGMFVVKMDVSWIKSPFLFHRRAIESKNDILLLKNAGVKKITIDIDKSHFVSQEKQEPDPALSELKEQADNKTSVDSVPPVHNEAINPDSIDSPSVALAEELEQAALLKKNACEAFDKINELVKKNQPVPIEEFEPVVDETISSLMRNSQALLTLMHLRRYEEKLFSHSFSVMSLALTFAIKEGVSHDNLKSLGMAALLHDIGWAQLPLSLFGKAKKYTDNELKVVQQHQNISNIIINKNDAVPQAVKQMVMQHHERIDGSGYPEHLKETQLDQLSRILILTDYYDESVHGLLDRPGLIPSEALRQLYKEAVQNKQDKEHVELLIKLLGIYPLTSAVELNSGEKGVVIEVNRDKPLIPVITIMYTAEGNALANPLTIDLKNDEKQRHIKGIVDLLNEKTDPQNLLVVKEL